MTSLWLWLQELTEAALKREQVMKRVGGGDAVETNKNVGRKQREEEMEKKQQELQIKEEEEEEQEEDKKKRRLLRLRH